MLLCLCRAVAAGLVSSISTGPLFPSLVAYLVLPIIAPLLGGHPHNTPKHIGTMLKLAKWLQTMRQNCFASLPSNNFPFLGEDTKLALCRICKQSVSCGGCNTKMYITTNLVQHLKVKHSEQTEEGTGERKGQRQGKSSSVADVVT